MSAEKERADQQGSSWVDRSRAAPKESSRRMFHVELETLVGAADCTEIVACTQSVVYRQSEYSPLTGERQNSGRLAGTPTRRG